MNCETGAKLLASGTANLRSHRVAMVQATQSRQRLNPAPAPWVDRYWTTRWGVLHQPQMRSIFMVIAYVSACSTGPAPISMLSSTTSHVAFWPGGSPIGLRR